MTQPELPLDNLKETQAERCRRVLAGVRGKVRVERASVYFDDAGEAHARAVAAAEAKRDIET